MKVMIRQAQYWHEDDGKKLLNDYQCLKKYEDYYHMDDGFYENCIIKDMDNKELFGIMQELTNEEELVIGYASKWEHEKMGIDFKIKIYDYYLE